MYTLEELAKEVGYKSMSYLRKLCKTNLTEGIDYIVSKRKTRVITTLKQTQKCISWFGSLTKVKNKVNKNVSSTSKQTSNESCVEYSRDDLTVISRDNHESVPQSDLERVLASVRDFLNVLLVETRELVSETRELVSETRELVSETRELRIGAEQRIIESRERRAEQQRRRADLRLKFSL